MTMVSPSNFVPTIVEGLRPRATLESAKAHEFVAGDQCDRYELVCPVACGGMANVWLARLRGKHGFERLVALKTILPTFARDPRFRNMFMDEARIASRIEHANVAQIFDLGEQDDNLYLVMEWVDGDSLANLACAAQDTPGGLPLPILLRVLADACAGLHAAHELCDERGRALDVVHRDVSPQNILVGTTGVVKVIDFGVAKARGRIAEETSTGMVKGKLHYMAPERAVGAFVDRRADVWAVGAVLYRLLAGHPAYDGVDDRSMIQRLITRVRPPPLPPAVPRSVTNIVARALAPEPSQRYATAAQLQHDLEIALHEFGAATTSLDVAAFVNERLGFKLAERREAIHTAVERLDQSATIRCAPVLNPAREIVLPEIAECAPAPCVQPSAGVLAWLGRLRLTAVATPLLGSCALCLAGIVSLLGQHLTARAEPQQARPATPVAEVTTASTRMLPAEEVRTTDPCSPPTIDVADLALERGHPRAVRGRLPKIQDKVTVARIASVTTPHMPAALPARVRVAAPPSATPPSPKPPPPHLGSTAPGYESLDSAVLPAPRALARTSVDDGF